MPVEMISGQWNPGQQRYRFETFCYGLKSRALDKAAPIRRVPGRQGMTWEEKESWMATTPSRSPEPTWVTIPPQSYRLPPPGPLPNPAGPC